MAYYFVRMQGGSKTDVTVMKVASIEEARAQSTDAVFVSQHPDIASAMAEVRRLNQQDPS